MQNKADSAVNIKTQEKKNNNNKETRKQGEANS